MTIRASFHKLTIALVKVLGGDRVFLCLVIKKQSIFRGVTAVK